MQQHTIDYNSVLILLSDWRKLIRHHYMMTLSNGNIFPVTGPLWRKFDGHRWIPLTKANDAELWWCFFICPCTNGWANHRDTAYLRRHHAHYYVTVMTNYDPFRWRMYALPNSVISRINNVQSFQYNDIFVWRRKRFHTYHYADVIMTTIAPQITSRTIVYSTIYSGADQSKHQSSASLAFVWGVHRGPVNSPHKWPVTRKIFPFDDVIMFLFIYWFLFHHLYAHL